MMLSACGTLTLVRTGPASLGSSQGSEVLLDEHREPMTYDDYRLAAIYDADNLGGVDHDYFRALVDRPGVQRIVDLGCGTGSLTVTLTGPARRLIGIDPAAAMLAYAAARPGGDAIEWRLGTSESIDPDSADLILMSANVSMHTWSVMRGRPPWPDVASGLVPGGTLAFESRNPAAEAWRTWNDQTTERETAAGRLRESTKTTPPDSDGVVSMYCHNTSSMPGAFLMSNNACSFEPRSKSSLILTQPV